MKLYDINGLDYNSDLTNQDIVNNFNYKNNKILKDYKKASDVHRQVRKEIKKYLYPGNSLRKINNKFDELIIKYSDKNQINNGLGFPCTISINNCLAHSALIPNQDIIIDKNDIIKFDFGTNYNKWIVDSAFTVSWNKNYQPLHDAVHDAIMSCIKQCGPDVRMCELGKIIYEIMSSYEITLGNKVFTIKPITNLGGHNILNGSIHGGKFVPSYNNNDNTKMKEGEIYAIETFGVCVNNLYMNDMNSYINRNDPFNTLYLIPENKKNSSNKIIKSLYQQFNTLPFSDNWIKKYSDVSLVDFKDNYKKLTNNKLIKSFPPLYHRSKHNISAQYEHTIFISDKGSLNISIGNDY